MTNLCYPTSKASALLIFPYMSCFWVADAFIFVCQGANFQVEWYLELTTNCGNGSLKVTYLRKWFEESRQSTEPHFWQKGKRAGNMSKEDMFEKFTHNANNSQQRRMLQNCTNFLFSVKVQTMEEKLIKPEPGCHSRKPEQSAHSKQMKIIYITPTEIQSVKLSIHVVSCRLVDDSNPK